MKDWFTVEKLNMNTYVISEYKHHEEMHSYLLLGSEKALLIDSGLGIGNICAEVKKITDLPVITALTHAHWDHMGGLKCFDEVAVHKKDAAWVEFGFPLSLSAVKLSLQNVKGELPEDFDLDNYEIYQRKPAIRMKNYYKIDLGNRVIEAIHTPGHSPGHVCFYERETGALYTGNLIYKGKIDLYYQSTNPYKYARSINKIGKLDVKNIYPAHFDLNISPKIIDQIKDALKQLKRENKLRRGEGIIKFQDFKLHL
jgi:glyoxylase-like metal-dependent hydrolase (beta-lactamase superfamily II)